MKKYVSILISVIVLSGCVPKIGKDIFIEPQGNLRWESTQTEIVLGVLSLLGISTKSGDIRFGSDLKVLNKWHSDITIVSLTYTLSDTKEVFARGEAKKDGTQSILIPSGGQKMIPLEFRIDAKQLNSNRFLGIVQSKRKLYVKGEAVIEVWGIQKRHLFEKEVTTAIQKVLNGG